MRFRVRGLLLVLVGLLATGSRSIAQPLGAFTDESTVRGLDYFTDNGSITAWGWGTCMADLDNDGDVDIVATGNVFFDIGVYRNIGNGHFQDLTYFSGIPPLLNSCCVIAGDYDGDHDLDLYVGCWLAPNHLYRNEGNMHFTEVTASAIGGIGDPGAVTGMAWGDYDGDGWLDISVSNYTGVEGSTEPNRLYHNNQDGTFTDVAPSLGVDNDYFCFGAYFLDYDRDGDADLYCSNGKGAGAYYRENNMFENIGGAFADRSLAAGTAAYIDSMGVGLGDFDGDGYIDIYCTNVPFGNVLFLNNQDGTFVDATLDSGTSSYRFGWGAIFLDYDNDTNMELHICNWSAGDRLYTHGGVFPCEDIAESVGLAEGTLTSTTSSSGDIDGDGDTDLLVQGNADQLHLMINNVGQERSWLRVKLEQPGANFHAIGATIDVYFDGIRRTREVLAGQSFKGQMPALQVFGLGDATIVDQIDVLWPGGATTSYSNVDVNQTVWITPTSISGTRFVRGDADGDGAVAIGDVVASLEVLFMVGAGTNCQDAIDGNDDGVLNVADPVYLLSYLFTGGPSPAAPFPSCGTDPTPDVGANLGCSASSCL